MYFIRFIITFILFCFETNFIDKKCNQSDNAFCSFIELIYILSILPIGISFFVLKWNIIMWVHMPLLLLIVSYLAVNHIIDYIETTKSNKEYAAKQEKIKDHMKWVREHKKGIIK